MSNKTTNYELEKPLQTEFYDVEVQNRNMDKIDTQMKENADSMLKKDGSAQMTGVLKTVGGAGIAEQIELHNCHVYTDSTGHIWFASNLYFNGTEWRYKTDGAGIVFSISGSEAVLTAPLLLYVAEPDLKDAVATLSQTHVLTTETGLPLTGGTLTGQLVIAQPSYPSMYIKDTIVNRGNLLNYSTVSNLHNYLDSNNYARIILDSENAPLNAALQLGRKVSGAETFYNLYHTGNLTISTSAPSSTLANGAQHQVY